MKHSFPLYRFGAPLILTCLLNLFSGFGWASSRIFYLDSYHPGYTHSDHERSAFLSAFINEPVSIQVRYLNSKKRPNKSYLQAEAQKIRDEIQHYQPDLIVAADDNANRYVITPYFKDSGIPVVFLGVNNNADEYGYPTPSITGVLEVSFIHTVYHELTEYLPDKAMGAYLMFNTGHIQKHVDLIKQNNMRLKLVLVNTQDAWEKAYAEIQEKYDFLLMAGQDAIADFDYQRAIKFVQQHARIPSGSLSGSSEAQLASINFSQRSKEQGKIAATMAKAILNGLSPSQLPIRRNEDARVFVNSTLIKQTETRVDLNVIRVASPTH